MPDHPESRSQSDEAFEAQARFARTMGHPVRLKILHMLHVADAPVPSQDLLQTLDLTPPGLSQHLARMSAVGLIRTSREGKQLLIELAAPEIGQACDLVRQALARRAQEAADSFSG